MGPKFLDYALILFMGFFAVNRFMNGQLFFGVMFGVLCLLNIVSLVVKYKRSKENTETQK